MSQKALAAPVFIAFLPLTMHIPVMLTPKSGDIDPLKFQHNKEQIWHDKITIFFFSYFRL